MPNARASIVRRGKHESSFGGTANTNCQEGDIEQERRQATFIKQLQNGSLTYVRFISHYRAEKSIGVLQRKGYRDSTTKDTVGHTHARTRANTQGEDGRGWVDYIPFLRAANSAISRRYSSSSELSPCRGFHKTRGRKSEDIMNSASQAIFQEPMRFEQQTAVDRPMRYKLRVV